MRPLHTLLVKNYELWERSPRYQRFVYYTNLPAAFVIRESAIFGGWLFERKYTTKVSYRKFRAEQLAEIQATREWAIGLVQEVMQAEAEQETMHSCWVPEEDEF